MEQKKPEKQFSTGAIQAAVWNNDVASENGTQPNSFKSIVLSRRYKDKEGNWKSTNSLRVNDLPKAALVLQKAYEYLVFRNEADNAEIQMSGSVQQALHV